VTIYAGALAGTLMALIFIGHMAYALVFNMPDAIQRRMETDTATKLSRIMMMAAAIVLPMWAGLGAVFAVLAETAQDRVSFGTDYLPSALYLVIVVAIVFITAPLALLYLPKIRTHIAVEFVIFLGIFGFMIPLLVAAQ
jgi:hypothetical protein